MAVVEAKQVDLMMVEHPAIIQRNQQIEQIKRMMMEQQQQEKMAVHQQHSEILKFDPLYVKLQQIKTAQKSGTKTKKSAVVGPSSYSSNEQLHL
ncbi:hypothetical protein niasHT_037885 [Heterodera trifolii]|uniref:Uncharacterized protein n=1 Tax=Heterodera trifolii TaxID=157864 RepID=A0ABD2IQG6_9BILA